MKLLCNDCIVKSAIQIILNWIDAMECCMLIGRGQDRRSKHTNSSVNQRAPDAVKSSTLYLCLHKSTSASCALWLTCIIKLVSCIITKIIPTYIQSCSFRCVLWWECSLMQWWTSTRNIRAEKEVCLSCFLQSWLFHVFLMCKSLCIKC